MALGLASLVTRKDGTLKVSVWGNGSLRFDRNEFRELYEAGEKMVVIICRLGVTKEACRQAREKLGLQKRVGNGRPSCIDPEQFTRLYESGVKMSEIARRFGVGEDACRKIRQKLGILPRRGGRTKSIRPG